MKSFGIPRAGSSKKASSASKRKMMAKAKTQEASGVLAAASFKASQVGKQDGESRNAVSRGKLATVPTEESGRVNPFVTIEGARASSSKPSEVGRQVLERIERGRPIFSTIADLAQIIQIYESNRKEALDPKSEGKPVMNNRCSRDHPMFNQTVVHKGKIILSPKSSADEQFEMLTCSSVHRRRHFEKFKTNKKSAAIVKNLIKQDKSYFQTVLHSTPTPNVASREG